MNTKVACAQGLPTKKWPSNGTPNRCKDSVQRLEQQIAEMKAQSWLILADWTLESVVIWPEILCRTCLMIIDDQMCMSRICPEMPEIPKSTQEVQSATSLVPTALPNMLNIL